MRGVALRNIHCLCLFTFQTAFSDLCVHFFFFLSSASPSLFQLDFSPGMGSILGRVLFFFPIISLFFFPSFFLPLLHFFPSFFCPTLISFSPFSLPSFLFFFLLVFSYSLSSSSFSFFLFLSFFFSHSFFFSLFPPFILFFLLSPSYLFLVVFICLFVFPSRPSIIFFFSYLFHLFAKGPAINKILPPAFPTACPTPH